MENDAVRYNLCVDSHRPLGNEKVSFFFVADGGALFSCGSVCRLFVYLKIFTLKCNS